MNLRFLWMILLAIPAIDAQTTPAPFVISADKGWFSGASPLSRKDGVPDGAKVAARETGDLILQCPEAKIYSYSCRLKPCEVQACKTLRAAGMEIKEVALAGAGLGFLKWDRLFTREPLAPVFAVARAGGNPNDAVLRQDAKGVHFGPALNRILEGRYCLRLRSLPLGSSPALTATLEWDRALDAAGVAPVPGLKAGLHSMEVGTPETSGTCRVDPDRTPAWILAAAEPSYANLNRSWRDVVSRLNDLERAGSSASLLATLRHAALATLADSGGSQ